MVAWRASDRGFPCGEVASIQNLYASFSSVATVWLPTLRVKGGSPKLWRGQVFVSVPDVASS
jgi:hypothetical protein